MQSLQVIASPKNLVVVARFQQSDLMQSPQCTPQIPLNNIQVFPTKRLNAVAAIFPEFDDCQWLYEFPTKRLNAVAARD